MRRSTVKLDESVIIIGINSAAEWMWIYRFNFGFNNNRLMLREYFFPHVDYQLPAKRSADTPTRKDI